MKKIYACAGLLGLFLVSAVHAQPVQEKVKLKDTDIYAASEDSALSDPWKGDLPSRDWSVSAMTGLGITHPGTGWAFAVAASRRMVRETPLNEISNDIHAELQVGPVLLFGSTLGVQVPLVISALARWDFHYSEQWTFSALGGLGLSWANMAGLNLWNFYPRFALAAFFRLSDRFGLRGEISHEHTMAGVAAFF